MNKISYIILLLIAASLLACGGGNSAPSAADISSLEAKYSDAISRPTSTLQNDELNGIIRELVTAYESFAKGNHEDPASLGYLYKAAELYETNLGEPTKAIGIFDEIIDNHAEHERAADALFKKGYIYNNTFGDTARARVAYQNFISKYPDHPMHKDAVFEIKNLGKSPEEILNEILEKKAAADSAGVE
jgi:tetratricopeptide (TPR) repeat protein